MVDTPITCPDKGLFTTGRAAVQIDLSNCWKAHSSNMIRSAVKERAAFSPLAKH